MHPLFVLIMLSSVFTGFFDELATLFGIVLIHELGHVAAAKSFSWKVKEIQLLPFGGVAVVDGQGDVPASQEIVVALAGPLQNGWMIALTVLVQSLGAVHGSWWNYFIEANLMIGLFNMLPVLPLDGGRVMQAGLSCRLSFHRTLWVCTVLSLLISAGLVVFSLSQVFGAGIQLNLLVIGVFLLYANWIEYRNIPYRFIRFLIGRYERKRPFSPGGSLAQPIVVYGHQPIADIMRLFVKEKYHLIYVMDSGGVGISKILPEQCLLQRYFADNEPGCAVSLISCRI